MALNKFPSYEELRNKSPEILKIIEQPIEKGDIVEISGYPGTGKTLVSGLKFLHCNNNNKIYLTYSQMLLAYTKQGLEKSESNNKFTSNNIFTFNKYLFNASTNKVEGFNDKDHEIRIKNLPFKYGDGKILFLDEAQDISPDIAAKLSLKFDSIIICGDKDQAIDETRAGSDFFQDYENSLYKNDPEFEDKYLFRNPGKLYKNYRNTKPIFEFAKQFQPDALPLQDIKIMREGGEKPQLRVGDKFNLSDEISRLCADGISNQQTIGIIAESTEDIERIHARIENSLRRELKVFDKDTVQEYYYEKYDNTKDRELACKACMEANVVIATPKSAKGLEFDIVIFWKLEKSKIRINNAIKRNTYYVSMTRAKDRLIICQDNENFGSFNVEPSSYDILYIEEPEETNSINNTTEDDEFDLPF